MSRSLPLQIIANAIITVSDRKRWTKHVATRGANGSRRGSATSDVTRYCAFAALMKAASDVALDPEQARALALRAERHVINANQWERGARLSKFNDEHSHRAVLAAMQLSLAYAE